MKSRLQLLSILLFPLMMCGLAWYFWYSPTTTVFLVRHAERLNTSDTTSISEEGIQRANTLAHALTVSGLARIFVSEKHRTVQTAQPTATALNITPIEIPAKEIQQFVDSVKAHRGEVMLIVGHSDTVPQIIAKLGITSPPAIPAQEFDNLFVVTVFRFRTTMTRLKY